MGVCNLCNRAVKFIIKRDPEAEFKFSALQSAYAKQLLQKKGFQSNPGFIVYFRGDRIFTKSTAILMILKELKDLWSYSFALIIIPKFIRDFFYDFISRYRYRIFGKQESCMIPTAEIKNRFL